MAPPPSPREKRWSLAPRRAVSGPTAARFCSGGQLESEHACSCTAGGCEPQPGTEESPVPVKRRLGFLFFGPTTSAALCLVNVVTLVWWFLRPEFSEVELLSPR